MTGPRRITTPRQAEQFLARVGIALRYRATPSLPLASLYQAAGGSNPSRKALARAIELTNHLLAIAYGIEVELIGKRLTLVHRSLMPALYVLVRRGRAPDDLTGLGLHARAAYRLIEQKREVSAGDVRRHLGLTSTPRSDPAYEVLGELRRQLVIDRGPFAVPKTGIPYLSKEGYPWHLFDQAHADLVTAAGKVSEAKAADVFVSGYLAGARSCAVRKIAAMFRAFLSREEMSAALDRLESSRRLTIQVSGRERIVFWAGP